MKTRYFLPVFLFVAQLSFAGELFVKVSAAGNFRANISGQMQSNYTNIYRFFDLPAGTQQLQVVNQFSNQLFAAVNFTVNTDERIIAEIDQFGYARIIQREYIHYAGWGNGAYVGTVYPPYGQGGQYGNTAVVDPYFPQFMNGLRQESFDSNKLTFASDYASRTRLSASQIADIAKEFTFDSNRLEWAKAAYTSCYDPQNYFLLKNVFTFSSNYNALSEYVATH